VTLQLDNSIKIVKLGQGMQLPINELSIDGAIEPDPPERPDSLIFVANKTRVQFDLQLEAIGLDLNFDNKDFPAGITVTKPINELSYTPTVNGIRTWEYCDVGYFEESEKIKGKRFRELAQKSVFKWYRIKVPFVIKWKDGSGMLIETRDRILPIEDVQIEKDIDNNRHVPRPAWVYGLFEPELDTTDNSDKDSDTPDGDIFNKPDGLYHGSFSIDKERGFVQFAEPIYRYAEDASGNLTYKEAVLYLRVTFSIRDEDTRAWERHLKKRDMPAPLSGTKPRYITRDDVTVEFIFEKGTSPPTDNLEDVQSAAEHYLDAAQAEYQFDAPASVTYAGFLPIPPDGAIRQVGWSVDGQGFARTRASRNREELMYVPSFKERRRLEKLRDALKAERETERQKGKKRAKGQA